MDIRVACRTALLLTLFSAAGAAAEPAVAHIVVDAAQSGAPLEPVWPYYGYDEINYTTVPKGKALLSALVAANTASVHVRNHFVFNTGDGAPALKWGSTNIYTEDSTGNPVYGWGLSDGIFDAMTTAGAYPFVEIGFMPQALSSHPVPYRNSSSTRLDGGSLYPPKDYPAWAALVGSFAQHVNQRYADVTTNWLWELWNEPDLGYFQGTFAEYAKLYDYTESALHAELPGAALGGPAVAGAGSSFLRQFLQHCASGTNAVSGELGTRLDLVTFHAKGGVAMVGDHVQMNLGNQLRIHRAGFEAVAAVPPYERTPIYITEADPDGCAACPASTTPANAYRNSGAYGAYELAMMKRTLELEAKQGVKLGGLLTWAFTFPGSAYFAGYRELSSNGLNLPVLSAFKLLGRLTGMRVPLTSDASYTLDDVLEGGVRAQPDIDGMAARSGDVVRILVWNYHDDLVPAETSRVHLTVQLPVTLVSSAWVSHLRVDEGHGNAYAAWVGQGMPAIPSAAQLAALRVAMDPSPLVPDRTLPIAPQGSLELDFDLPRFGISLITLSPPRAGDTSDAADPLEEGRPAQACACRLTPGSSGAYGTFLSLVLSGVLLIAHARRRARLIGDGIGGCLPLRWLTRRPTFSLRRFQRLPPRVLRKTLINEDPQRSVGVVRRVRADLGSVQH